MVLWVLWVAVMVVGLSLAGWLGHFPFGFPAVRGTAFLGGVTLTPALLGSALAGAIFGAVSGAPVAVAQWLVLRWAVAMSAWWAVATMGGLALLHALGDPVGDSGQVPLLSVTFALVAVGSGVVIGALQFPLVRSRLRRAAWWIPASTAGWALGVLAGALLVTSTGLDRSANREAHTLAGAVAGVLVGVVTGSPLSALRVHP
jgi:hypothetical protein